MLLKYLPERRKTRSGSEKNCPESVNRENDD